MASPREDLASLLVGAPPPLAEARALLLSLCEVAAGSARVTLHAAQVLCADGRVVALDEEGPARPGGDGEVLGYPAPEVNQRQPGDARSLVYSVAAIGYHLLTGRPPLQAASVAALIIRQLLEHPAAPSSLRAESPAALDVALLRALHHQKDQRPADVAALLTLLRGAWPEGALAGAPPAPSPAFSLPAPSPAFSLPAPSLVGGGPPGYGGPPGAAPSPALSTGSHAPISGALAPGAMDEVLGPAERRRRWLLSALAVLGGGTLLLVVGLFTLSRRSAPVASLEPTPAPSPAPRPSPQPPVPPVESGLRNEASKSDVHDLRRSPAPAAPPASISAPTRPPARRSSPAPSLGGPASPKGGARSEVSADRVRGSARPKRSSEATPPAPPPPPPPPAPGQGATSAGGAGGSATGRGEGSAPAATGAPSASPRVARPAQAPPRVAPPAPAPPPAPSRAPLLLALLVLGLGLLAAAFALARRRPPRQAPRRPTLAPDERTVVMPSLTGPTLQPPTLQPPTLSPTPQPPTLQPTEPLPPLRRVTRPAFAAFEVGGYRCVAPLGEGGMGMVYKALDRLDRVCAVKVLLPQVAAQASAVALFRREARLAASINHPHSVFIYDFGEIAGAMLYLAMEFIDGTTLADVLRATRPGGPRPSEADPGERLPIPRVLHITRQIAEVLDTAHRLGVIHRDLKPHNVMLTQRAGSADFVKVVDFGIARSLAGDATVQTMAGAVMGTPAYMSPEQAMGEDNLDPRSDLFSLGLLIYRMLGGVLPYGGTGMTPVQQIVQRAMLQRAPAPLRSLRPDIPPALEALVQRALEPDRARRTASAAQLLDELDGIAA